MNASVSSFKIKYVLILSDALRSIQKEFYETSSNQINRVLQSMHANQQSLEDLDQIKKDLFEKERKYSDERHIIEEEMQRLQETVVRLEAERQELLAQCEELKNRPSVASSQDVPPIAPDAGSAESSPVGFRVEMPDLTNVF